MLGGRAPHHGRVCHADAVCLRRQHNLVPPRIRVPSFHVLVVRRVGVFFLENLDGSLQIKFTESCALWAFLCICAHQPIRRAGTLTERTLKLFIAGFSVFFANRTTALLATTGGAELILLLLILYRAPCQHVMFVNHLKAFALGQSFPV